jgi:endonuclease YncB( thermonuclease family)
MRIRTTLVAFGLLALPGVAHADPCEGPLPHRAGETFSGTVRYIGDGDSLCVGQSDDANTWIEVRLADFNAPELHSPSGPQAKQALERIAMGHAAQCVAGGGRHGNVTSYDRVIATCRVNDRRIGDLMREAGVREGGN